MTVAEEPLILRCEGERLVAILHRPASAQPRGVLLIVGGPQYRVGSHRQFVLLARYLASRGLPVLRFDYRGMGDSEGADIGFESAGADIRVALNALAEATGVREIVIWGLCDAASATLLHGCGDERVRGIVLVNPWVRQPQTEARAVLQHYYRSRLLDPLLWKRLFAGQVNVWKSATDLLKTAARSFGGRLGSASRSDAAVKSAESFVVGMVQGLESFRGRVLLILSGDDLTAAEFKDTVRDSPRWSRALDRASVVRRDFPEANHTFSRAVWREDVAACTEQWIASL